MMDVTKKLANIASEAISYYRAGELDKALLSIAAAANAENFKDQEVNEFSSEKVCVTA